VIWLLRWLVFRVMLGAGLIKLRGDPCWRDFTCLIYHYQSQPMPNPLSWYFHHLPIIVHKAGVAFNHVAELIAPWLCLVPLRKVTITGGLLIVVFQGILILSGNLSWLNWLTIVIAISCFDDRALAHVLPVHAGALHGIAMPHQLALAGLGLIVAGLSVLPVLNMISPRQAMNASFEPLHIVNTYGAFGSVSKERYEVVLEGTADTAVTDSSVWKEYEFKGKPGDPAHTPPIVAPYHLRLDWLMWFAGLDRAYAEPWIGQLVVRLLQNDRPTLSLIRVNPFPDRPPAWIRANLYEYRFTSGAEKRATGRWWSREPVGAYVPPLSLGTPGLLEALRRQGFVP
jgi:hypothetical protein